MSKFWTWSHWMTYKHPYKEGWAYILRKDHRMFRLVPFDPKYSESFEFEGHVYSIVPELMVRLRRYDPRIDNAHFGFMYIGRWLTPKKIGILKFKEWEEGIPNPVYPEDHIKIIEDHKLDKLNPFRYRIAVLEQVVDDAFKSVKQTQPINKKWIIMIIIIMIGVAAFLYLMFGGGATVHAA